MCVCTSTCIMYVCMYVLVLVHIHHVVVSTTMMYHVWMERLEEARGEEVITVCQTRECSPLNFYEIRIHSFRVSLFA